MATTASTDLGVAARRLLVVGPLVLVLVAGVLWSPAAFAHVTVAGPSPREDAAMAYDAATNAVVLFGGYSKSFTQLGDTWEWEGRSWRRLHPATSPPARTGAQMAYDPRARQLLLFGGYGGGKRHLHDTWAWNGRTWTELHPRLHPPSEVGGVMAYDAAIKRIVLSAGSSPTATHPSGSTWLWNGTTWVQVVNVGVQPVGLTFAMGYDPSTHRLVRFGGSDLCPSRGCAPEATAQASETLTWAQGVWTAEMPTVSPPARSGGSMAYDAASRAFVLFGGTDAAASSVRTWTWNGTTWAAAPAAASPPGRWGVDLAYDARTRELVLFGGQRAHTAFCGDTWTWNGTTWRHRGGACQPQRPAK